MAVDAVTDASFETDVLKSELPVFIDLWAPWCGPCRMVAPVVEKLSEEFAGKMKFVKVNVDENRAISEAFQATSIPMLAILKGNTVVDRVVGAQPHPLLNKWVTAALEAIEKGLPEAPDEKPAS